MDTTDRTDWADDDVAGAVGSHRFWYHSIEVRPGLVTPGWFDLRPIVDSLPWPDVRGKRCLDVGTYDGFLAFHLERLGAAEVVATDIGDEKDWDWPPGMREAGLEWLRQAGSEKGKGFEIASKALGSRVRRAEINVYDLSPETVGSFDVVVCGSLLLHLRDPFRALAAIRSVCTEHFLSCEQIDAMLSVVHRRRPVTKLGPFSQTQWHVPNLAGHRAMVGVSGFTIEKTMRPYAIPLGPSHPVAPKRRAAAASAFLRRVVTGGAGVPHSAVLARPI